MNTSVLAVGVLLACAFLCQWTAGDVVPNCETCDRSHCWLAFNGICRCAPGYFGENCTVEACAMRDILQNECQNQTCKMDASAYKGYKCIPNVCETNNTCNENEMCAWNQSTGRIQCLSDPCSKCGLNQICDFNALYSNTTCPCVLGYHIKTECVRPKPCDNDTDPCFNGGICGPPDDKGVTSCICTEGYGGGQRCEYHVCETGLCGNGTCMKTEVPPFYNCSCNEGYTGENCTDMVNPCQGVDCNHGTCESVGNSYNCTCEQGYYGTKCEFDNPCECVNNGTCSDGICHCPSGSTGDKCAQPDHCAVSPCLNDGVCSNGQNDAMCTCTAGYTGANCSEYICANSSCGNGTVQHAGEGGKLVCRCDCFDGYAGPQCQYLTCSGLKEQHQLDNGCYNEAPCTDTDTGFTCECPEGTTGTLCEVTIQHCQPGVCNETGTRECRNLPQGRRCMCRSGFTGETCSETKTPCKNFPCKNGGVCEGRGLNDFLCMCPSPFTGRTCGKTLESCDNVTCLNRGRCAVKGNGTSCNCADGFNREDCALPEDEPTEPPNNCEGGSCPPLCTLTTVQGEPCDDVFGNGVCNAECATAACLQDGFDCRQVESRCPASVRSYCVQQSQNGICNEECNIESCRFDGGDCTATNDFLEGTLVVVLFVESVEEFDKHLSEFLLAIGEALNCIAQFVDRRLVNGQKGTVSKRQSDSSEVQVEVDMKLDVQYCNETKESCLTSVDEAANVISNLSQRTGYTPAGYRVVSARREDEPETVGPTTGPQFPLAAIVGIVIGAAFITVAVIATVGIIKRKRTIRAAVWRPEGQSNSTRSSSFDEDSSPAKRVVLGKDQSNKDLRSEAESYPMKPISNGADALPLWRDVSADGVQMSKAAKSCIVGQERVDASSWHCLHYRALHNQSQVQNCVQRFNRDTDYITDINIRGPGGYTALMIAVMSGQVRSEGDDESDSECVRPSLLNGVSSAISGNNPLTVKDLLRMNADPNLKNELGQSALHIAAACSRADAARLLLRHRADPNIPDISGRTPLHVAIASEADGVFQIIIRHKSTNPEAEAEDGVTPLILATQHHDQSMVEQLLKEAHVDPNAHEANGKTALHWAASMNMVGIMRILQKHGANKDAQDNQGQTPLFLAAKEGSSDAVRLLLECFANRNIQDSMERTPLRIARERFHEDIVRMLTDWGFNGSPAPGSQASPHEHSHMSIQVNNGFHPRGSYLPEATALAPPPYTPAEPTGALQKSEKSRYRSPNYVPLATKCNGVYTYSPPDSEHIGACRVLPVGSEFVDDAVGFHPTTTYAGMESDSRVHASTAVSEMYDPLAFTEQDPIAALISPPESYPSAHSSPYQQQRPSSDPLLDCISPLLPPTINSSSSQSSPYGQSVYTQPSYPSPPESNHGNPITPPFESNNGQLVQVLTPPESNSQSPPHELDRQSPMGGCRYASMQGYHHGQGVGPY